MKTCGTIGFRKVGAKEVGMLGLLGTQASHKGTGRIESGSKVIWTRFSFMAEKSGTLLSGRGRFFSEEPTDMSVRVKILLVAGGVSTRVGQPAAAYSAAHVSESRRVVAGGAGVTAVCALDR